MKADKTSAVPLVGKWHQGPIGNCFIHQNIQTFVTSSVFFVFHMECKSAHTCVILLRKPVCWRATNRIQMDDSNCGLVANIIFMTNCWCFIYSDDLIESVNEVAIRVFE